MKNEMQFMW